MLSSGDLTLGHYDKRYFHEIVSDEERTDTQQHMIRAYLEFFRTNNLDTWIAHGTLLGWWWNGKVGIGNPTFCSHTNQYSAFRGTLIWTPKSPVLRYNISARSTIKQCTNTARQTARLIGNSFLMLTPGSGSASVETE